MPVTAILPLHVMIVLSYGTCYIITFPKCICGVQSAIIQVRDFNFFTGNKKLFHSWLHKQVSYLLSASESFDVWRLHEFIFIAPSLFMSYARSLPLLVMHTRMVFSIIQFGIGTQPTMVIIHESTGASWLLSSIYQMQSIFFQHVMPPWIQK